MSHRTTLAALIVLVLGAAAPAAAQIPQPVVVSDELPDPPRGQLVQRRAALLQERDAIRARVDAHNANCRSVPEGSAAAADCRAAQGPLNQAINAYAAAVRAFNDDVARAGGPPPLASAEIDRIVREIRNIRVPPPIPPEEVAIRFGQLAPGDHRTTQAMVVAEGLLAVGDIVMSFGGVGPRLKLAIATARVAVPVTHLAIADADAADVYLMRQTATYERALAYLKDPATRQRFTELVRALKEGRPLPENASIDMARAAQAVVDVGAGNTTTRVFLGAIKSPEAVNAMLTRGLIEAGGYLVGHASGALVQRVMAAREPAYLAGTAALPRLQQALARAQTPGDRRVAEAAVREAEELVASAYRMHDQDKRAMEHIVSIFTKEREAERREIPPER